MNLNTGAVLLGSAAMCLMALSACGGENPTPPASTAERVAPEPTPHLSSLENTAPEVDASAQLTEAAVLQLSGSAVDETLPSGTLSTQWTQVSGPAQVTFADASVVDTTATFTAVGTYVLRLTVTDGEFTISDDVTVVVQR